MSEESRVFVLERSKYGDDHLRKFGRVTYLFEREGQRHSIWSEEYVADVLRELCTRKFDPSRDYFAVVGHMVPLVIVAATLPQVYGVVNALMFNAVDREYVIKVIGDANVTKRGRIVQER